MAVVDAEELLRSKARELRRTALPDWNAFLEAMAAYVDDRCHRVLTAENTEQLLEFKGQAKAVKWLTQVLATAHLTEKSRG